MQSQINPHLLYNTLDSILWLQQSGNAQSATELVTALSGFFKFSLSRGKPMIPLRDEIQLVPVLFADPASGAAKKYPAGKPDR